MYFKGVLLSEPVGSEHINVEELKALDRALDRFQTEIQPGVLTWQVDNNAALVRV